MQDFLRSVFDVKYLKLPVSTCQQCSKVHKSAARLKAHQARKHPAPLEHSPNTDEVHQHAQLLLRVLLLKKHLDDAISYGDGQSLVSCVKHMYLYFRCNNNYKYALACFELLAELKYFVSEKVATSLIQDRFVNMRGASDSNYPADLLVEHSNKVFKNNFYMFRGEPTQQLLNRMSKSQTMTSEILDNFQKEFATARFVGQHKVNQEKYDNDISILCRAVVPQHLFLPQNRQLSTPKLTHMDPIPSIDAYALLDWMRSKIDHVRTESYLA